MAKRKTASDTARATLDIAAPPGDPTQPEAEGGPVVSDAAAVDDRDADYDSSRGPDAIAVDQDADDPAVSSTAEEAEPDCQAAESADTDHRDNPQTTQTTQRDTDTDQRETGGVTFSAVGAAGLGSQARPRETRREATNRWCREGRTSEVEGFREQVRKSSALQGMPRYAASELAWERALSQFPPPGVTPEAEATEPEAPEPVEISPDPTERGVFGLGDLPSAWPKLPPNSSLSSEIQWVQSSRIDVVEELPGGGVRVDLSRADRPSPSKSAIGWLETSIRFPAKFADVAVRATQHNEDEQAHARREKVAIGEIRRLLAEMSEDV